MDRAIGRWTFWLLVSGVVGCRGDERCERAFLAGAYERAAALCSRDFERSRKPRAAVRAAEALYRLRSFDGVLAWADRRGDDPAWARVVYLAGVIHQDRGDRQAARDAYLRALDLATEGDDPGTAAQSAAKLAAQCWRASEHRKGIEYARRGYLEAVRARAPTLQLVALQALFPLLHDIGDLVSAREVLRLAHELVPPDDKQTAARLLVSEGLLLFNDGRVLLSRKSFAEAWQLVALSDDHAMQRTVHLNLAGVALDLEEADDAERHIRAAKRFLGPGEETNVAILYHQAELAILRKDYPRARNLLDAALAFDPVPDWAWELEYAQGRVFEASGDSPRAERAYRRAIDIVERLRSSMQIDDLRYWVLTEGRGPFERLFALQARSRRPDQALETAERARARTFLKALASSRPPMEAGGKTSWLQAESNEPIDALIRLLPAVTTSPVASSRPVGEVMKACQRRHAIAYFFAAGRLWLLVVGRGEVAVKPLAITPDEADKRVGQLLARPDSVELASLLGRALLPDDALPAPGSVIHLVTDGALGKIPFAALRRKGRYLVEDYASVYLPSLSALATLDAAPPGEYDAARVFGDPRGDLPGAAQEAKQVAAHLDVRALIGTQASSGQLRLARRAAILHLATHTGIDRVPWLTLADRRVYASQVLGWQLKPRLVVLASCASAARNGKGMWGTLPAAFLASGSKAVLASMWSVGDRLTRDFIRRFYAQGGAGRPGLALAEAQRHMLAAGHPPSAWAPFVLIGSSRAARTSP